MKTVVLLYDTSCIYEIVILNYFLKYSGKDVVFASLDGNTIEAMEGYSMNVNGPLESFSPEDVELMILPGGNIESIDQIEVWNYLEKVANHGGLIAAICAGVDVVDHAGLLENQASTHSLEEDVVVSNQIITARANAYVDFAIEVAKKLDLFEDEEDLKETIAFWREHQRVD